MQCFGPFNMLTVHKCSDTRLFGYLSHPAFCSLLFQEKNNLQGSSFVSKYSKFYTDSVNPEKIQKIFFDFEIIAF